MRAREAIRVILSFYIWGFITYQLLPLQIIPYTNYAPRDLHPNPVVYPYTFAYDVKTALSNHAGSLPNLLTAMENKGFDIALVNFTERVGNKLFPLQDTNCYVIRASEISPIKEVLYLMFELFPKIIVGREPDPIMSRGFYPPTSTCYILAHDENVLISLSLGLDIPPYRWILGKGKNLHLSREAFIRDLDMEHLLRSSMVLFTEDDVRIYAYSDRSFYLPGEKTVYSFRITVRTGIKNPLILLYKDEILKGIYRQDRINVKVSEEGKYTVQVAGYKFRLSSFYFGLRTFALASPITRVPQRTR